MDWGNGLTTKVNLEEEPIYKQEQGQNLQDSLMSFLCYCTGAKLGE